MQTLRQPSPALPVREQVEGHRAHPGLRVVVPADLGPARKQSDKRLLHNLLSLVAIASRDGQDADEARVCGCIQRPYIAPVAVHVSNTPERRARFQRTRQFSLGSQRLLSG